MTEEARPHPSQLKLWQALIIYPAILTTLGGSIPTAWQAFKAWRLDVSYSKVAQAEAQQDLWERNLDCLTTRPVYSLEIEGGVQLSVTLCASGDALLQYQRGSASTYTWVPYPPLLPQGRETAGGLAWADEPPRPIRIILGTTRCVQVRPPLVVRLVQAQEGQCHLEHIVIATGSVVSRVAVPCTARCAAPQ